MEIVMTFTQFMFIIGVALGMAFGMTLCLLTMKD